MSHKFTLEVKLQDDPVTRRIAAEDFEADANNNLLIKLANDEGLVCYAAGQWLGFTLKKEENTNESST